MEGETIQESAVRLAGAMKTQFNAALATLATGRRAPWSLIRPGALVEPLVSASEAASQAPTREATPAPESRPSRMPTPAPAPGPIRDPDTRPIPEPEPDPERERRKRRRVDKRDEAPRYPGPHRKRNSEESGHTPPATTLARRARRNTGPDPVRLTPAAYQAVDTQARFGLVECSRVVAPRHKERPHVVEGHTLVLAHTPAGQDPLALQGFYPGGAIRVLRAFAPDKEGVDLRIGFVTRPGYIAPGRPATSVLLGVPDEDWARVAA